MAAYVIVEINVTDPERYEEYKKCVPPSIEAYGGRFLVRGGATETLEGDWDPKRFVMLEFESVDRAKEWWGSEEYRGPRDMRWSASDARMIVVEGC